VDEIGERLGDQPEAIKAMTKDGKLRHRKLARRSYVIEEAIQEWFRPQRPLDEPGEEVD
jgi:hypothetical protein